LFLGIIISPVINASTLKTINNKSINNNSNIIFNEESNKFLCEILMRIGIFIEELYKYFPQGTLMYPILLFMLLPVILLWNRFCDEFTLSYDLSLTGNFQITSKIKEI